MQLLVTLTSAIGLASTALALSIPGADIPDVPGSLARRAVANCQFTYTVTESYAKSGAAATKTVFKHVESKPTAVNCGAQSTCSVVVKTSTRGTVSKVISVFKIFYHRGAERLYILQLM
ncbi:hypothetical protein TWF173_003669 [Orbilia oligospora]|nr:hypothetical protein TWF173_003669 [Orbilia oligospora]